MKYSDRVMSGRRTTLRVAAVVVLAALTLTITSCGGSDDSARGSVTPVKRSGSTTSTSTSIATTTTSMPEVPLVDAPPMDNPTIRGVVEGYMAWTNAFLAGAITGDPDLPQLTESSSGGVLSSSQLALRSMIERGERARLPIPTTSQVRVIDLQMENANTGRLTTCEIDDGILFRVSDGSTADNTVHKSLITSAVVRDGSRWRVADRHVEEAGSRCD